VYNLKHLLWLAAAGISGAFIGMTSSPAERTPWQRLVFLLSGLLVAFWLTPFLCKQFNLSNPEEISAMAFSSGAFWSSIVTRIGQLINTFNLPKNGGSAQ
jgi:hypothetical protein